MKLKGRTPIRSTEDPEKVLSCVLNIFPNCRYESVKDEIIFDTVDLERFIELLGSQQIRDTAVMVLERKLEKDASSFFLSKTAAYMGKINFTEGGSTLGDIEITIVDGARELIEGITPVLD
jgi:predicted RNA binding protein with dsRBD fold (UPF0201 family)